jgi:hypothetical protein
MVGVNVIGALRPLVGSHLTTSHGGLRPLRVKTGKARVEHLLSGLPPNSGRSSSTYGFAFSPVGRYLTATGKAAFCASLPL